MDIDENIFKDDGTPKEENTNTDEKSIQETC